MTGSQSTRPHRKIRLPMEAYRTPGTTWLVTISAFDRDSRPFESDWLAREVISALNTSHRLRSCRLLAYCLMPDHLHVVTTVEDGDDLVKLIDGFKSFSTKVWRDGDGSGPLWQVSFHDRGLRTSEDIGVGVRYVWNNPARVGLIADGEAYAFLGGGLFESS